MKILIVGFLVLLGWSSLSTYVYVCKIKGLCYEVEPISVREAVNVVVSPPDTSTKALVRERVVIPEALLSWFAFDKSEFGSGDEAIKYFEESMAYMFQNSEATLSITGHTDAVGSIAYNEALGYRRAKSVQNFFESKGMPSSKIMIQSKGETEPAGSNSTISGRSNNRRAVVTIKP